MTGSGPVGTAYGWDGDLLSEEAPLGADGSPDWSRATRWHYEPGTFRPIAREGADGSLLYVVTDHLGTPRELLDEAGSLVWAAEYRVWGAVRRIWVAANDDTEAGSPPRGGDRNGGRSFYANGNLARAVAPDTDAHRAEIAAILLCPIRFQGQWQDQETGLAYNRYRYYDALTAQYVSPDPIVIKGGTRPHGYVVTPITLVDPIGLICCSRRKLQHEYKHASDFGVNDPNPNNQTLQKFSEAIDNHVNDPSTQAIPGTYRGTTPGTAYFNPITNNYAFEDASGNLVAAFKLGPQQVSNLFRGGNVQ